jgi:hypothetical protein
MTFVSLCRLTGDPYTGFPRRLFPFDFKALKLWAPRITHASDIASTTTTTARARKFAAPLAVIQ